MGPTHGIVIQIHFIKKEILLHFSLLQCKNTNVQPLPREDHI